MRAAVLPAFHQALKLTDVTEPRASEDEVLVRVRAVGLCGTDLKITSGAFPDIHLPHILGHEVAGEVISDSVDFARGQRVACALYAPCGTCSWCRKGQEVLCPNVDRVGFERQGGLAEVVAIRRQNALPFAVSLPFKVGAVAMDAVMSPWRALNTRAALRDGETIVVVGAGGLGLNAVQIACLVGARVAVVDPLESHRALTEELGAELAVAPVDAQQVVAWADGGTDVAFEGSGTRDGFEAALTCLRKGGRLVCCGYRPGLDFAVDSAELVLREIAVLGSRGGSLQDARAALQAVQNGLVQPHISEVLPFEFVNQALDRLRNGDVLGRIVIGMGEE